MIEAAIASRQWTALGSEVVVATVNSQSLDAACAAVQDVLNDIDDACSRFRNDSELSRLNAAAGKAVAVSPLLFAALRAAVSAAEVSDSLVDPTVGDALVAVGYDVTFAALASQGPPLSVSLRSVPGWRVIELDRAASTVRVPKGTSIDLGAIGKALAADRAAAAALAATGSGVLVSCGGDISVAGEPCPGGWIVELRDHGNAAAPIQLVAVDSGGLATSGTGVRRWRRGTQELHHIIDPRTGAPAVGPWSMVSAVAADCVTANTLTTAAIILGDAAAAWLQSRGVAARLLGKGGEIVLTGGWPA